tara:strand:- start:475 stop:657 length:183 start_codon:yes stop_codon:yes gene_type:complete
MSTGKRSVEILASAARTATAVSATFKAYEVVGSTFILNVTADPAAASITYSVAANHQIDV